jgi:hypothetical protein
VVNQIKAEMGRAKIYHIEEKEALLMEIQVREEVQVATLFLMCHLQGRDILLP